MVHPDKCRHPRAKDAFEVIGAANKDLQDEERLGKLAFLLNHAKGAGCGRCGAWCRVGCGGVGVGQGSVVGGGECWG